MSDRLALSPAEIEAAELSDEQLVRIAIADGKALKIRYDEGTQPGAVRSIRPVRFTDRFLLAFDGETAKPKKFRLDALFVVDPDELITYRPKRMRRVEVDPDIFFSSFAFEVKRPAFLSAFDFMRRKNAWTQGSPPRFDFDVGDVFAFPTPYFRTALGVYLDDVLIQVHECSHLRMRATGFRQRSGFWVETQSATFVPADFVDLLCHGPNSFHWRALF